MSAVAIPARYVKLSKSLASPSIMAFFLSLLFIGGDRFAIGGAGATVRFVTLPLMIAALVLLTDREPFCLEQNATVFFGLWSLAGLISVVNSFSLVTSVGYSLWIAFDFFMIAMVAYNFALRMPAKDLLFLWFVVFRLHVILLAIELVIRLSFHLEEGGHIRPHLWFYEPSYAAMFLGGYFASAIFLLGQGLGRYFFDVVLAGIGLLLLASATAVGGILFGLVLAFFTSPARWRILFWSLLITGGLLAIGFGWFATTPYFNLVAGFIRQIFDAHSSANIGSALLAIAQRGDNRFPRALLGWQAFREHPWFGIGIGADKYYLAAQPFSPVVHYYIGTVSSAREMTAEGLTFTNLFIEVLGSMGIVGLVPFVLILMHAAWRMFQPNPSDADTPAIRAFFVAFFAMIFLLQLDGNFLRYYLWLPYGLGLGLVSAKLRRAIA